MTHTLRPRHSAADEMIDAQGWDAAGRGGETSWYPPPEAPPRTPGFILWWRAKRWAFLGLGLMLAVVTMMSWPRSLCGCTKIASSETAAVQNLKALATAQAQYIKKHDTYAASGRELNASGTLIARDLANAFEAYQDNGDSIAPQPKAGYIFRMLQGDDLTNLRSFWKDADDPAQGMNTWGAICRPAEPGVSGDNQYYISEAGTVYKMSAPVAPDPRVNTFLLSAVPAQNQTTWRVAR